MADIKRFAPEIRSIDNRGTGDRGTETANVVSGQTYHIGSFFSPNVGTNGANGYAANQAVAGVIEDIETLVGLNYISVFDIPNALSAGTVVQATNNAPARYVAVSGDTGGKTRIRFRRITANDQVVAYLSEAGVLTARGTTPASNVVNNFIEPDATAPWTLQESSANTSATGRNFRIVAIPLKAPAQNLKVIVQLINNDGSNSA
jgi:hypothetical protein